MKVNAQDNWIDRIGMAAIVLVSLGYVLFGSTFAQLRLEFSFLNFPIFVGEILLAFTSFLFIIKSIRQKQELGPWGWILGAYLFFVLFKAFSGYHSWGPLAFRDAAFFYYPLFAVLGYSFWSNDLWGNKTRYLLITVILTILILHQFLYFWPCSLIIMGVILALQIRNFNERIFWTIAILIFAPHVGMFYVYFRAVFLSSLITMIFISVVSFLLFCRDQRVRIVGFALGGIFLGIVLFKAGQTGMGKTFMPNEAKPSAATLPQEPSRGKYLFHPVGSSPDKPDAIKEFLKRMHEGDFFMQKKSTVRAYVNDIRVKEDDTIFRYYIWRDMWHEYLWCKPLFGFDFGRPLFSPTLMKYRGSGSSQHTDGWVGAHNSFFNMIYRAGIVGLAMVLSIYVLWFGMLRDFYLLKDWTGLLLCAILLDWFVLANFFLIFELPYTAIPVWTILGITVKYRMMLKRSEV